MPRYTNPFDILLAGGDEDTIENDPFRKRFGGGLPTPSPTPTPISKPPTTTAGGSNDVFAALLSRLAQPNVQPQERLDLNELVKTLVAVKDPIGTANKLMSLPSYVSGSQSPFNTGFFNSSKNPLTPEARLASEGGSATAQYGLRGGVQGIDPDVLAKLMYQKKKPEYL